MALSLSSLLFFTLLLFVNIAILSITLSAAIIIPITKDSKTSLYSLKIKHRTPLVPVRLALDLGGPDLWLTCDNNYTSSSYTPGSCGSGACWLARALFTCNNCAVNSDPRPGCNNNTCTRQAIGLETSFRGEVGVDVFSFFSVSNGKTLDLNPYSTPIIFTCASSNNLNGLADSVTGIAGLGTTRTSLTSQISERLNHTNKFAVCLSKNGGALYIGADSILMHPIKKVTSYLTYTPLIRQIPDTNRNLSQNYYINVTSMKFNGKDVPLNKSLLSIDSSGRGGTKITTMLLYTTLQSSIYRTLIDTVAKTMSGLPRVIAPVKPFELCFDARHFGRAWAKVGPAAAFPQIKLVLENNVAWTLFSGNLFKRIGGAMCLAFVDGGSTAKASIVIGLHQIEDNILEFDLEKLRFGFSTSFLPTTCGNFRYN